MNIESDLGDWFDIQVTLGTVVQQVALARSADQLRWASYGTIEQIHREALPPGVVEIYGDEENEFAYFDEKTPAGREQATRIDHHKGIIWLSLTSILNAAGNISKLLWGNEEAEIRSQLRQILAQPERWEDSPLGERRFRNHFEHQDERLLTFLGNLRAAREVYPNAGGAVMHRVILSEKFRKNENGEDSLFARSAFGWWSPEVDKLWFLEDELHLGGLINAVIKIGDDAEKWLEAKSAQWLKKSMEATTEQN